MRGIDRLVRQFCDKIVIKRNIIHSVAKKQLEYLGKHLIEIKKRLERVINEQIPFCKINIVFSSKMKIKHFFSFKDKVPKHVKSLVLYKFKCSDCNITYIGKTYHHFRIRFSEHLGISKTTNLPLKYNKKSSTAVRDHIQIRRIVLGL